MYKINCIVFLQKRCIASNDLAEIWIKRSVTHHFDCGQKIFTILQKTKKLKLSFNFVAAGLEPMTIKVAESSTSHYTMRASSKLSDTTRLTMTPRILKIYKDIKDLWCFFVICFTHYCCSLKLLNIFNLL